jgi:hypothetical protein
LYIKDQGVVLKRPCRSFSRNDAAKSTASVFKNDPEVVFGGLLRVFAETTPKTPWAQFPERGRVVLGVVLPKGAGVVPEVVLRNTLRKWSVVVSENDPPSFSGSLRPLLESAGSRRLPRVFPFCCHISMAPKYNSPLKTSDIFEPEQISIGVTVTSPVSPPTLRCAGKSEGGAQSAAATAAAKQYTGVTMAPLFVGVHMYIITGGAANISRGTELYDSTLLSRLYPSL